MDQTGRLASLARRAPMPVIGVDRDGRLIYVNDSVCGLTGYDREEVVGGFFWEFLLGAGKRLFRQRFLRTRDEGVDNRFDTRVRTATGEELLISWHNVSFFGEDGRLEAVFSIGADVTPLDRAEMRLARLNIALQALSGISGLALRTDDARELLTRACEQLVDSGACVAAWIALVGDTGQLIGLVGSSIRNGTSPEALRSALREPSECIRRVLSGEPYAATDHIADRCADCLFTTAAPNVHGFATPISHGDETRAVLVTHIRDTRPLDDQTRRIIGSVADDLGFALAMLEDRAKHERTESALARHTRMLDVFFESSLDPAAILDPDFNFVRVNQAYADADDREPAEFVGRNHFEMYPNDENRAIFERVRDTGEPFSIHAKPFRYPERPEWGTTWWDWTLVPHLDRDGNVDLLSFWLRDVTEEQRAKAELEAQRNFVDAVVERAGSLVIVVDADGRVVRFNRTCEQVTGYSADEIRGRDFTEVLIPEEDRERVRADFQRLLREEVSEYENWWECRDGERRRIAWRLSTFVDRDGPLEFMIGTGWDVTQERKMSAALLESEEKYRELVENARTIIICWDLDGTIEFINDYGLELFGYTEAEIIGENVGVIIPDEDSDGVDLTELVESIAASPDDYLTNENENVAKDGTRYWISWSNRVIRDENGAPSAVMAIGLDRTEQKRAEERLRASEENLRDLAAELAMVERNERREIATMLHDNIGQLLAFAKIKLGSIAEQSADLGDELASVLQYVDEAIDETRSLTSQLSPPALDQLGFVAALEWLADEFSEHHDLPIHFKAEEEPERLSEEVSVTLFQAVRELLTNAIKHAEAGQVDVELSLKGDCVRIEVADDGQGFDPSSIGERRGRDEGFGLFNVQERLAYLGGDVAIDATPGEGATVTLICPIDVREKGSP
ncbi:MAG: PAS domain S-box protein [Armatimonadota bacterium]